MEMFSRTLSQMLMMFTFILVGFLLRKKRILPDDSGSVMAKLETNVFVPALSLYTMITKCTVKTLTDNSTIVLYGCALVACAVALAYILVPLFVPKKNRTPQDEYLSNVYKYALTFGNWGFMGNYIALSLWGADFFYQYSLFLICTTLVTYTWGLIILIPKEAGAGTWQNIKKGLLTPPVISVFAGLILGLLDVQQYIPEFLMSALDGAGKCQGPVAMLLAGFVIGGFDIKQMLTDKKVYAASGLRLLIIPAAMLLVMRLIGAPENIQLMALIAFATPLGLNTVVYPAAYGGDTRPGASMAMVSHVLCVITIPLMYLLFFVVL